MPRALARVCPQLKCGPTSGTPSSRKAFEHPGFLMRIAMMIAVARCLLKIAVAESPPACRRRSDGASADHENCRVGRYHRIPNRGVPRRLSLPVLAFLRERKACRNQSPCSPGARTTPQRHHLARRLGGCSPQPSGRLGASAPPRPRHVRFRLPSGPPSPGPEQPGAVRLDAIHPARQLRGPSPSDRHKAAMCIPPKIWP